MALEKTGDTEGLQKARETLKTRQNALKQYCADNDLKYKPDRTAVVDYRKSVSGFTPSDKKKRIAEIKGKTVDKSGGSGIIEVENSRTAVNDVHFIGKIDVEKYKCVTDDIKTDEVIITDKQIEHIKERHPNDYERYFDYAKEIIQNPDYILEANKPNTAFVLKHIIDNGKNYQLILRLKTSQDPKEYKNSVITFLKVEEKRYNRYLRTKKILYKSE